MGEVLSMTMKDNLSILLSFLTCILPPGPKLVHYMKVSLVRTKVPMPRLEVIAMTPCLACDDNHKLMLKDFVNNSKGQVQIQWSPHLPMPILWNGMEVTRD